MLALLLTFALALVSSVIATFWGRDLGHRAGIVDRPDGVRRLHSDTIPRVGGIAVFLGAFLGIFIPLALGLDADWAQGVMPSGVIPLGVGGVVIFLLGLVDDVRELRAWTKFAVEVALAVALYFSGVGLGSVSLGAGVVFTLPVWLDLSLTVLWFVGLMNAFNLIDGHDGVAGGVALIALATLSYAAVFNVNTPVAIPTLALSGAVLGFLLFNLPPASVFLGDAGSLFLGYSLAGLGLVAVAGAPGEPLPILVPTLALGLPVLDTSLSISRRFLRGDPVFRPDRGHIHHRLSDMGYPKTVVTLVLWGLAAIFSLVAVILLNRGGLMVGVGLTLAVTVSLVAIRWLETPELMELGRAVQRAFIQRRAIAQNVRLRDAVRLLDAATSTDEFADALDHAFQDSHCDHIELWVPADWETVLSRNPDFQRESFGVLWKAGEEHAPELWEIAVTLELATPKVGRLSLRYVDPGADALAHVDSIVRKLRPALCAALNRLLDAEPVAPEATGGEDEPPVSGGRAGGDTLP